MSIQVRGSKGYYNVDLNRETCTCKDFTCRRHHYDVGDPRRLCKHLREAFELYNSQEVNNGNERYTLPDHLIDDINELMKTDDNVLRFTYVGEYRRGVKYLNQLELVARVVRSEIMTKLSDHYSCESIDNSREVYLTSSGLNIVVNKVDDDSYPFKVFNLTGTPDFLIKVKSSYRRVGLELTEYGVKVDNMIADLDIGNEEEIFNYIGMDYVMPVDRM